MFTFENSLILSWVLSDSYILYFVPLPNTYFVILSNFFRKICNHSQDIQQYQTYIMNVGKNLWPKLYTLQLMMRLSYDKTLIDLWHIYSGLMKLFSFLSRNRLVKFHRYEYKVNSIPPKDEKHLLSSNTLDYF